jgi:hypothetical protein
LKHSAATETAAASTNRMMVFIGILPIIFEVYLSPVYWRIDQYQNAESRNSANVRYWPKADMGTCPLLGLKRTLPAMLRCSPMIEPYQ